MLGPVERALAQRRSLRSLAHRPWPLPPGRWRIGQSWNELLFAHWRADPAWLRALVPPALELDLHDGEAFVGIVAFQMQTVRFAWCPPVAGTSAFPELNVRTYVRVDDRPGVFFLSLDTGNVVAVALGRNLYHLPYRLARVSLHRRRDGVSFRSLYADGTGSASFCADFGPGGAPSPAPPGSLEHFLTERYCFYTVDAENTIRRTDVHHGAWPLQPATAELSENTMLLRYGLELAESPLVHFSRRQDVVAWSPQPVVQSLAEGGGGGGAALSRA